MSLDYYSIGQKIKEGRKRKGLSQIVFSEMIDKSPTYVSYIESGSKSMSLETFVQIANALDSSADELLIHQLKAATTAASQHVTALLSDCSDYEKRIILDAIKSLKAILREQKNLAARHNG